MSRRVVHELEICTAIVVLIFGMTLRCGMGDIADAIREAAKQQEPTDAK